MTTVKKRNTLLVTIVSLIAAIVIACTLAVIPQTHAEEATPSEVNWGQNNIWDIADGTAGKISASGSTESKTLTVTAESKMDLFGSMNILIATPTDVFAPCLDGLSYDVEYKDIKDGDAIGTTFGSNIYVRDNGLGIIMTNNGGKGELSFQWGGGPVQAGTKITCIGYADLADVDPLKNADHVRGEKAGYPLADDTVAKAIPFTTADVKLNIRFSAYSTYRYQVTITALSGSFDESLKNVTDDKYTFYVYAPDIPDIYANEGAKTTYVGLTAKSGEEPTSKMIFSNGLDYGKNPDMIADADILPKEVYGTETLTPQEGNYIVNIPAADWVAAGNAVYAEDNANGSIWIGCDRESATDSFGTRIGPMDEFTLNGLSITADYRQVKLGSFFGIVLGKTPTPYYNTGSGLSVVMKMQANTQARVYLQAHHDVNNAGGDFRRGYRTVEDAKGKAPADHVDCFIFDCTLPTNGSPTAAPKFRYTFNKVEGEENIWKFTIEILDTTTKFNNIMAGDRNNGVGGVMENNTVTTASLYFNATEIEYTVQNAPNEPGLFNDNEHVYLSVAPMMQGDTQGMVIMHIEQPLGTKIDSEDVTVTLADGPYNWTGSAIEPAVTSVKVGENTIDPKNYRVSYKNNTNAGEAVAVVNFVGNYIGSAEATFDITGIDASAAVVTFPKESYDYTGAALKPRPTVMLGETEIPASTFMTDYKDNTNAGTATVTVIFRGGYTGQVTATFTINKIHVDGTEKDDVTAAYGCTIASVTTDKYGAGTYTVKDANGNAVTSDTLKDGVYTVTFAEEETNTITTYTYTVTVAAKAKGGCKSQVGTVPTVLGALALLGCSVMLAKKRRKQN